MLPRFLLPETLARHDGASPEIALENCSLPVLLTLGITRILEQENLEVTIWASEDRKNWQQISAFPKKSYCGQYSLVLDLTRQPQVRYLRAQWTMGRWRPGQPNPLFGFYIYAEEVKLRHAGAA